MELCDLCLERKEHTRHLALYVWGSEGLRCCHECEMDLVRFCEKKARTVLRRRKKEHDEVIAERVQSCAKLPSKE